MLPGLPSINRINGCPQETQKHACRGDRIRSQFLRMSTPPSMTHPISTPLSGKPIRFTKASACGNDFLIIEGAAAGGDLAAISRRLFDRRNGVGADGGEWLYPDDQDDTRARLFNADGSEAEISGNGTRCVAAWLCSQKQKGEVAIRTGAGF